MCPPILEHEGESAPSDKRADKQRLSFYSVGGAVLTPVPVKNGLWLSLPGSGFRTKQTGAINSLDSGLHRR